MHALSSITNAMGRCGKVSKIYWDMRVSCSQLIQQGLESCTGRNEEKPTTRFKRCARSEPTLTIEKQPQTFSYLQKVQHGSRKKEIITTRGEDELPMNHYTINIYLNNTPNEQVLYAKNKSSSAEFSVDKLTKNIATSSSIIEGFLKNKDPDKDKEYIEEKLIRFWKDVFENSKLDRDGKEKQTFEETPLEKIDKLEVEVKQPEEIQDVKEPYFLNENQNEKIYVNSEFEKNENVFKEGQRIPTMYIEDEQIVQPTIPHYERGLYDSRTVKPKKIISPDNQERRRLSKDTIEVNKHIENLVRLSTQNNVSESPFSKIVTYCKNLLMKEEKEMNEANENIKINSTEETKEKNPIGYYNPKRKYHGNFNFNPRRNFSSNKHRKRSRDKKKSLYRNVEKSRHCLAGAATERENPTNSKRPKDRKQYEVETNLAKNANKFALFNSVLNSPAFNGEETNEEKAIAIRTLRFRNQKQNEEKITNSKAKPSRSKSETNLKIETVDLKPNQLKKVKSDGKISYGDVQDSKEIQKVEQKIIEKKDEDEIPKEEDVKIKTLDVNKMLRRRRRKSKDKKPVDDQNDDKTLMSEKPIISGKKVIKRSKQEKLFKPNRTYSTTFRKVSIEKPKKLGGSDKEKSRMSVMNAVRRFNKANYNENKRSKIKVLPNSKRFAINRKAPMGMSKRTMCTSSGQKKTNEEKCKKQKKHTKKEFVPTHKKLAKRSTVCPKEPLQYEDLHARCPDALKSDIPKKDVVTDIKGLLDSSKQEQFKDYFGESGYRNHEYYSYTRTSFYDLNTYMTPLRNTQPSSKAKPR